MGFSAVWDISSKGSTGRDGPGQAPSRHHVRNGPSRAKSARTCNGATTARTTGAGDPRRRSHIVEQQQPADADRGPGQRHEASVAGRGRVTRSQPPVTIASTPATMIIAIPAAGCIPGLSSTPWPTSRSTRTAIERDLRRILVVQAIRAALYGFGTVVLGTSLAASGLSDAQVGLVFTAMLAGMALATICVGVVGRPDGAPPDLHGAARACSASSGTVFALTDRRSLILVVAAPDRHDVDRRQRIRTDHVGGAGDDRAGASRHPAPRLRPVQRRGVPRGRVRGAGGGRARVPREPS